MVTSAKRLPRVLLVFGIVAFLFAVFSASFAEDAPDYLGLADEAWRKSDIKQAKANYLRVWEERGAVNDTSEHREIYTRVLMRLGRCCLDLDEQSDGQVWLRKLIATYPTDHEKCAAAQLWIGRSLVWQLKHDEADKALDSILTGYPQERGVCARALFAKADINMRLGRYSSAVDVLKRLMTDYADQRKLCKEAKWVLADALRDSFRTDETLALLASMYQSDEYSAKGKADILLRRAELLLRVDRWAETRATCEQVLADHAGSEQLCGQAKLMLAQSLCMEGKEMDRAMSLIDELRGMSLNQDRYTQAQLAMWTGGCYWLKQDRAKAEEWLGKVIAEYPDQLEIVGEAYYHRARVRAWAGDYDAAAEDIKRIPMPYLQRFARGQLHFFQMSWSDAAVEFEQVIDELPSDRVLSYEPFKALERLATCYSRMGDQAAADRAKERLEEFMKKRH